MAKSKSSRQNIFIVKMEMSLWEITCTLIPKLNNSTNMNAIFSTPEIFSQNKDQDYGLGQLLLHVL